MKRSCKMIARLALFCLILSLPACGGPDPVAPRIDHSLQQTKDPKEQKKLLQQAQKQYGPKETSK